MVFGERLHASIHTVALGTFLGPPQHVDQQFHSTLQGGIVTTVYRWGNWVLEQGLIECCKNSGPLFPKVLAVLRPMRQKGHYVRRPSPSQPRGQWGLLTLGVLRFVALISLSLCTHQWQGQILLSECHWLRGSSRSTAWKGGWGGPSGRGQGRSCRSLTVGASPPAVTASQARGDGTACSCCEQPPYWPGTPIPGQHSCQSSPAPFSQDGSMVVKPLWLWEFHEFYLLYLIIIISIT